jgi:hypothetical protein
MSGRVETAAIRTGASPGRVDGKPTPPAFTRKHYRVAELRAVHGLGKGKTFELLKRGVLVGLKVDGCLFVTAESVDRLFANAEPWMRR